MLIDGLMRGKGRSLGLSASSVRTNSSTLSISLTSNEVSCLNFTFNSLKTRARLESACNSSCSFL